MTGHHSGIVTSTTLLVRLRAAEPEAWTRFVRLYSPHFDSWCRQARLQEADVLDVGQDVFRVVSRKIGSFQRDADVGTFRGWLRTTTRNKVIDFHRRNAHGGQGAGGSDAQAELADLPDAGDEPDARAVLEDEKLLLYRAVDLVTADLPPERRTAFIRVVLEGGDPAEVAESLGLSVNVVYLTKSRVLRLLRKEYAGEFDLEPPEPGGP